MIFLHGWGGDARAFLFAAKSLKCTSTLVDFYGFGKTPHPNYSLSVSDYAYGVLEIMDTLGIKKATLVGHSFGGRVAIELAAKFPDRVEKLVLVDSAGILPKRGLKFYFRLLKHKILKFLRGYGLEGSADFKSLSGAIAGTFINVVNYDQRHLLKNINAPTAIFWGDKDYDTPLYMAKIFNKKIKNSHLFIFTNCGHFSYLDNSGKFIRILSAFIYG